MVEPQIVVHDVSPTGRPSEQGGGYADFLEILLVLAREKKRIMQITLAATLLTTVIVFLFPKMYTATATILPPQQKQSIVNSLLAPVGLAAGLDLKDLGTTNPSDTFVAMMRSRTVEDALINKFDLRKLYWKKRYQDARKVLEKRSEINPEKEGVITIKVDDRDPQRAADIANAWVDELHKLSQSLALTEAAHRRVFFEQTMDAERTRLSQAELALKQLQQKTGLIQPEAQGRAMIGAVAEVRAQVTSKEVQLQSMRAYATEDNPDVKRAEKELAELRSQLARLASMQRSGADLEQGNLQVPAGRIPETTLEYLNAARELRYHETLYEFLGKQLEAARIDEAKNAVLIQVVDKAVAPERKSSPKRLLVIAIATLLAFLLACFGVLCLEAVRRKAGDPIDGPRLSLLRHYLRTSK